MRLLIFIVADTLVARNSVT